MLTYLNYNILILLILSGILAYVGDLTGRMLGKKRVSLPFMRPKTTAILISVLTGMLITIVTLAILAAISEDARIALFQINQIKKERNELNENYGAIKTEYERALAVLKELNESKEKLKAESMQLEKSLEIKRKEKVVFQPDELLDFVVITTKLNVNDIEKQFRELIDRICQYAQALGLKSRPYEVIWAQLRDPLLETSKKLKPGQELIVYLKTTQRVMVGEYIDDVKVSAEVNRVIYKKGQILDFDYVSPDRGETEHVIIDGSKSRELIKIELLAFLDKLRTKVKSDGMIIEPFSSFDSITLHDMINDISKYKCKIRLSVEITENVSIIGPFGFRIKFYKI